MSDKDTYLRIGRFTWYGWKATAFLIAIIYGVGIPVALTVKWLLS